MKNKRMVFGMAAAVIAIAALSVLAGFKYLSPTRIAFVNHPEYLLAPLMDQEFPDSIELSSISWNEKAGEGLEKYDMVIFFGMGLNFTAEQRKHIDGLRVPVFVTASTRKETAINTLNEEHSAKLRKYLEFGGRKNFLRMCNYIRREIDGKSFGTVKIEDPEEVLKTGYFRGGGGPLFRTCSEYIAELRKNGLYHEGAPTVAILTGNGGGDISVLADELAKRHINAIGIAGMADAVAMLHQAQPDIVVSFPHGRLSMARPEDAMDYLREHNIPLFTPIRVNQLYDEFLRDQRGMTGGMLSQSIIMPELDGAAAPYVLFALFRNSRGLAEYRMIPERAAHFAEMLEKTAGLRRKSNSEKKIAIFYYKEPGKNAMVAGGLEVGHSLFNTLNHLKQSGFDTGELPRSVEELEKMIQSGGAVFESYAAAAQSEFDSRAAIAISREEFTAWCEKAMLPELRAAMTGAEGGFPAVLKLGGLRFGNLLLMPQGASGRGDNENTVVHGVKQVPPYPYIASYLYCRFGFKADAVIHFGTHGSLEFTPWKQVALSGFDWPDVLISGVPHFYLYVINNIGEALIAKRRSYATIVSHLTAPFMNAESSGPLAELSKKIDDYETVESNLLKAEYAGSIAEMAGKLNIGKELALPEVLAPENIAAIHNYIHEIENSRVNRGLYVIGRPYSEADAAETASLMLEDRRSGETAPGQPRMSADAGQMAAMLNAGKFPDGREMPEEMKKAMKAMAKNGADAEKSLPAQAKSHAEKIAETKAALLSSTRCELAALVNVLSGGYTEPSSGGDPIANPDAVPTGRNLYGVDPDRMPTRESWSVGKQLAEALIEESIRNNGRHPQKVAFSLWGGEFIRTRGVDIAEIFFLLGVEPVWDSRNRVVDVRLIPMEELRRPRIDVVVQTSGQFRGAATGRMRLLDKAVRLASEDSGSGGDNYVRTGSLAAARSLIASGMSPELARELATARIFGGANGNFGTGVTGRIQSGGQWDDTAAIAGQYIANMGTLYTEGHWGEHVDGLFTAALAGTDTVVQSRSSNTWGPLSLDHVYEFTGGISMAAKQVNGTLPAAYFNDLRTPGKAVIQEVGRAAMIEARSTLLNPKYVAAMLEEGPTAAANFAAAFRNTFGWEVTRPGMIDDYLWEEYKAVYVDDKLSLGVREFFETKNPYALQEMTGVMLESIRKGYWDAAPETVAELAGLHAGLVEKYEAGCSGYVCNNPKLREMIAENLPDAEAKERYMKAVDKVTGNRGSGEEVSGRTLKEETVELTPEGETSDRSLRLLGIIAAAAVLILLLGRRRRKV